MAKAEQYLGQWLERLENKGEVVLNARHIRVPMVFDDDEDEHEVRQANYGDMAACHAAWNSAHSNKTHAALTASPITHALYLTDLDQKRKSWSVDPLKEAITFCKHRQGLVIGDFGCGAAGLAAAVGDTHVVHSFDHCNENQNPAITICDIGAGVPLDDESLDLVIFSLSLMGSNWRDYLKEAWRCLRTGAQVLIWVPTKQSITPELAAAVEEAGFQLVDNLENYKWSHIKALRVPRRPSPRSRSKAHQP